MSIYLKPGMVKVRQEDDEFSEINILAESSSQAYLDAIQAKGEEVLESIPSEYGDLVEEVDGKLDSPQTAGTSGQVLTSDGQGGQSWETPGECTVTDVQVGGTSVLENGVANIPKANTSTYGAVQLDTYGGLQIGSNGKIKINPASSANIKESTDPNRPLVSSHQHESVFYGLAKASGDTTQSQSDNPVGNYTVQAKTAIQEMLNVPDKSDIPDVPVEDVQINGNSITNDGVADIPIGTIGNPGLININTTYGLNTASGYTSIQQASNDNIKAGVSAYRPIVPDKQHQSVFYGLAKAAGDTTQSQSSNSVGTYTDEAKSAIQDMLNVPDKSDITVDDVQINGTSIVNNGIAEIPLSAPGVYGLIKVSNNSNGTGLNIDTYGNLAVSPAALSAIKEGTNGMRPIPPIRQHAATFYGLTKAAGVDMASSDNPVGTYTEEAKSAIQSMLGIQNNVLWTESVSGTIPTITAEANTKYICGEVATLTFTPPANGTASVRFESGTTPTVLTIPNTVKFPEWFDTTELEAEKIYEILISDGTYGTVITWQA